jgi:hypothetical protein
MMMSPGSGRLEEGVVIASPHSWALAVCESSGLFTGIASVGVSLPWESFFAVSRVLEKPTVTKLLRSPVIVARIG